MKRIVHTVVDVEILVNAKENHLTTPRMKSGRVIAVAFYPFSTPTSNVNVKFETHRGEEIHPSVTYKNFEPTTGGEYEKSFKPMNFKGGEDIEIKMHSKTALTEDFKGQFIFTIEQLIDNN